MFSSSINSLAPAEMRQSVPQISTVAKADSESWTFWVLAGDWLPQ